MASNFLKQILPLALLFGLSVTSQASVAIWHEVATRNSTEANQPPHRKLMLDAEQLQARIDESTLAQAPLRLDAPLPDGSTVPITLQPTSLLSTELQQRYPSIKTWRVQSTHADILSGRAELTARGFHLMLRSRDGDQWLIEPETLTQQSTTHHYKSYSKRQTNQQYTRTFSCGTQASTLNLNWQTPDHPIQARDGSQTYVQRAGKNLLSYDIAISATGEYTQQFGTSKDSAYGAIVTTVNRINEIYEQELGITLKLVSGTETVFNDPETDPFENASSLASARQNQSVLDSIVGSNRYDIGHVLGMAFGGDGVALVSSICREGKKAQGFTASNTLSGDSFIIDYVAHELGHQLGATHTFNSTMSSCGGGGRIASTAFEPGSGSTIMSYAGLCTNDNIQQNVDAQFHNGSIAQIHAITHDGPAKSCATNVSLDNNLPVANAGADYTIPARTPFILHGSASDTDGDKLLYGWDQVDTGTASKLGTDTANNPLIMSSHLSRSGMRNVPDISRLLTTSQANSSGESLPRSNRSLNFRLTVRDGKGSSSSDDAKLTVHDTGKRFSVLSPTTSLSPGRHEISWQVAGTDKTPINCRQVDIGYTNNQGTTFTEVLRNTDNDGSEMIQLTNRAERIRIKCSNNIFFALSGTNPHIATYKNDSGQSSGTNSNNGSSSGGGLSTISSGGGGGSLPLHLLYLAGILTTLIKLRQVNMRSRNRQASFINAS